MPERDFVMALVTDPHGRSETEAVFLSDDGCTLVLELPDGSTVQVDDRELAEARGEAA